MRRTLATLCAIGLATAGFAAVSGAALAQPSRLTDGQYLAAVRCEALMNAPGLGKVDSSAIAATLRSQAVARAPELFDRADGIRETVATQVRHADASSRAELIAERSGACQSFATN